MTNPTAPKLLTFDLHSELFIGYSRAKYAESYTTIPTETYSPALADLMAAFAKSLGQEPDSTPLTIVSNEGYAQRVSGPRVYRDPSDNTLVVRYDREVIPVVRTESEDGEVAFTINDSAVTIGLQGENPMLILGLGKGRKVYIPFHTVYQEEKISGLELSAKIEAGNYEVISDVPGTGGSINFSALKDLEIGTYKVLKTEVSTGGKFGPKTKITVEAFGEMTIPCSVSVDGVWTKDNVTINEGAKIVVDANTSLVRTLQGLSLTGKEGVLLDIFGKDVNPDDQKVYVRCAFDFSKSTLAFNF